MKVVGFIGEPASGKSTYMRELMEGFGESELKEEGMVKYHEFREQKAFVLGIYDDQVFSGTDRLSKAVGPKFRDWLTKLNSNPFYKDWTVYWEGERLSNNPSIQHMLKTCETQLYLIKAPEEVLDERNKNRSNQNETWRKGMRTRIKNLCKKYPIYGTIKTA